VTRVYQKVKTKFNFYIDRAIDWADTISTEANNIQSPKVSEKVRSISQAFGDYGRVCIDFPRLDVFNIVGPRGRIIYIGDRDPKQIALMRTLFSNTYQEVHEGRVALWQLSDNLQKWLEQADFVVCKLSRRSPWAPQALYVFDNPIKIRQALTLDKPLDELIAQVGEYKLRLNVQQAIRQVQAANFTCKFSQAIADFDYFYYNMYLPAARRFDEAALVFSYEGLLKYGMKRGGLLLLQLNDQPVGAVLVYIQNSTCFMLVCGMLNGDTDLRDKGINIAFYWYSLQWAISQGAKYINFGGTNAWKSDGVFFAKRRWGAKVVDYLLEHSQYVFLANQFSPEWRDHLNQTGFFTRVQDKYLQIHIDDLDQPYTSAEIEKQEKQAKSRGLDGIQIVSRGSKHNFL
jgi:hypothetical protein